MLPISVTDIAQEVRRLAEGLPNQTAVCRYVNPTQNRPECIVGTALHRFGATVDELLSVEKKGAPQAFEKLGIRIGEDEHTALQFVHAVQFAQDNGLTWGLSCRLAQTYGADRAMFDERQRVQFTDRVRYERDRQSLPRPIRAIPDHAIWAGADSTPFVATFQPAFDPKLVAFDEFSLAPPIPASLPAACGQLSEPTKTQLDAVLQAASQLTSESVKELALT